MTTSATTYVEQWKPNAIQIPVSIVLGYTQNMYTDADFIQAVVDLYELQMGNTPLQTEPVSDEPLDTAQEQEEGSDRYSWFNIELRQRFPDVEEVPSNSVDIVFSAADNNRQWIADILDITLDYHNTKSVVSKPLGFIISALKRGTQEQAQEQVRAIRKYQESSGNSLVDSALAEARKRIKEPVPEPRQSRLRQLKEENERQPSPSS